MVQSVIRLVITDDHEIVRHTLSAIVDSLDNIEVVGEAANGAEAIALCEQCQPDLVLMDLSMPIMDGVMATRQICQRFPQIRVLILTSGIDPDMIAAALNAGAQGYIEKRIGIDVLVKAIWTAVK